jgi:hypothetical protein
MANAKTEVFWNSMFLAIELLCLLLIAWWVPYSHLPLPGWAVAVMAVAAAVMSVQNDLKPWQKALWILVLAGFLVTELRAISKDRTEGDARALSDREAQDTAFQGVRKEQDGDLKVTVQHLSDVYNLSQTQFEATMKKESGILDQSKKAVATAAETVKTMIGGDSWGLIEMNLMQGANAPPVYRLTISNQSKKYILRNVIVRAFQMDARPIRAYPQCNGGTIPADYRGADLPESCAIYVPPGVESSFKFLMSADNGSVQEDMNISAQGIRTTKVYKQLPDSKIKILKDW